MKCPKCNYENTIGSTFCRNCGGSLVVMKEESEVIEIMDDFDIKDETEIVDFTISMPKIEKPAFDYQVNEALSKPDTNYLGNGASFESVNPVENMPSFVNVPNKVEGVNDFVNVPSKVEGVNDFVNVPNRVESTSNGNNLSIIDLIKVIFSLLLSPMTIFKKHGNDFRIIKNSVTLSAIVSLLFSINFLVNEILNKIIVTEVNFFGPTETKFVLENIKNVNYLYFVFFFLGTIVGFMALASIFYIGGIIAKKAVDFSKLISVIVLSFSPVVIGITLSSLLFFLPYYFMVGILAVSSIYFVILLINFINHDVVFSSENGSIYYMLGCYGTISVLMTIIGAILVQIYIVNPLKDLFPF